jgi:hypothetical protein
MTQFHFDPGTHATLMREAVPAYGRLQQEVGLAAAGLEASSVLDLGTGTGDHADAVIPVTHGHDRPSTLADQLHWLRAAGFDAATTWSEQDLVVVRADRPV